MGLAAPEDDEATRAAKPELRIELPSGRPFVPRNLRLVSNSKTIEVTFDGAYHATIKATPAEPGFMGEETFGKKAVKRVTLKVMAPRPPHFAPAGSNFRRHTP